jgi:hypothetical protein
MVFFLLFSLIIIQYMRKLYVMFVICVFRTGRVIAILYSSGLGSMLGRRVILLLGQGPSEVVRRNRTRVLYVEEE